MPRFEFGSKKKLCEQIVNQPEEIKKIKQLAELPTNEIYSCIFTCTPNESDHT